MTRTLRLVPLLLLGLGAALALVALVALRWYAIDGSPAVGPSGFTELPPSPDSGRHHGVLTWALVLISVVVALGSLLPWPGVALGCRAGAPAVAAAALLWVLVTTLLVVGLVSSGPVPSSWSAAPDLGVAVEVVGLVLLGVGAALGPRAHAPSDPRATSEVVATS